MDVTPEHNSDVFTSMRRQVEEYQPGLSKDATLAESVSPYWNNEISPIERPFLTYEEIQERQTRAKRLKLAEQRLSEQSKIVQMHVNKLIDEVGKDRGADAVGAFLAKNFLERILPRVDLVTAKYHLAKTDQDNYRYFNWFNKLPDLNSKSIESLSQEIAAFIYNDLAELAEGRTDESDLKIIWQLFMRAAAVTRSYRQEVPLFFKLTEREFNEKDAYAAIARMTSDKWWLNALRRHNNAWREHLQIALNNVSKKKSIYASRVTISEWREQKRRTREFLKSMELKDEEGNRVSLIDKFYGSSANPAIRRTEMMVRIRGFENICNELGYVAEFYTLTAPSKYHATTRHGHRNRKWNGSSPADTQKYLSKVWSKIRAKLHRDDLRIFGIRVAEPHHDGTPHWHMLFFMRPEEAPAVQKILRDYAYQEDFHELTTRKALKARFHAEVIDPDKGSATGYVAKYISKNVDGYAMDDEKDDESGQPMKEAAKAAAAWSARWNIRQFQFIGGAPVTVYRELRRMADHDTAAGLDISFAAVHDAADHGDWAGYINAQGGPFVKRDELVARLWYEETEEINDYGEEIIRIKGVFTPIVGIDTPILTRLKQWKIVPKLDDANAESAVSGANAPPRSSVNNCTEARRTINGNEKKIRSVMADLRSTGREISPEQAGKLISGSGIVIDGREITLLPDGQLRYRASTTEKYEKYRKKSASILARVGKMRSGL